MSMSRWMPNDLTSRRSDWLKAGCFETLAEDLRVIR